MKGLRPLLRLDDKVAAEGRRLQSLGAGTSRWGGLTLLAAAAILHGMILMLPAVRVKATLPAASPAPDLPRVWRFDPPSPPAASPAPAPEPEAPSPSPAAAVDLGAAAPIRSAEDRPSAPAEARSLSIEPVPEPMPDVSMRMIASEVQAHIPYPDAPPPPLEPAPPFAAPPQAPDGGAPRVLARTQPAYPFAARSVGAEGQVRLRVSVLPDGRVQQASILDCSRPGVGFETAAIEAVRRWRYEPAPQAAAARDATVTIQFKKPESRK